MQEDVSEVMLTNHLYSCRYVTFGSLSSKLHNFRPDGLISDHIAMALQRNIGNATTAHLPSRRQQCRQVQGVCFCAKRDGGEIDMQSKVCNV